MIGRRGFLGGILAAAAAPAIITTPGLLMPVRKIINDPFGTRGFLPVNYYVWVHPSLAEDLNVRGMPPQAKAPGLEIGHYDGIRIIKSSAAEMTAAAMLMQQNAADRQLWATLERFSKKIRL